jgi:hypothetical protein
MGMAVSLHSINSSKGGAHSRADENAAPISPASPPRLDIEDAGPR